MFETLANFACVQCGENPSHTVALKLDVNVGDPRPSIVLAYFLCTRCANLYWQEAGEKVMASMKDSFKE